MNSTLSEPKLHVFNIHSPTPLQTKVLASLIHLISEAYILSMVYTHAFKTKGGFP